MRKVLIALCLLALACDGAEPRRLLMARHRSAAAAAAEAGPTPFAQWLIESDVNPWPDNIGDEDMDRSAAAANPTFVAASGGVVAHFTADGGDTATVPHWAGVNTVTNGFAVSFWAKRTSAVRYFRGPIAEQLGSWFLGEGAGDNYIRFRIADDDSASHNLQAKVLFDYASEVGAWHHYIGVWDGGLDTNAIALYMDGAAVGTKTELNFDVGMEPPVAGVTFTKASFRNGQDRLELYEYTSDLTAEWASDLYDAQKGDYGL